MTREPRPLSPTPRPPYFRYHTHVDIHRITATTAPNTTGVVIVIDVIRAFSVAAYAFAGGARALWLVRTQEEAFALRQRAPDALLAGEIGGRLIPGFDLNNSPAAMARADVRGRFIIQRTGAGTRGAAAAAKARHLLVGSLVNARATARLARRLADEDAVPVALFPTDVTAGIETFEDDICADYLEALLRDAGGASEALARGIEYLRRCGRLDAYQSGDSDFPSDDIPAVMDVDRFDFGMVGSRRECTGIRYVEVRRADAARGL